MKIKFDSSLSYQQDAIESIVDVFKGQETCNSNFTVYSPEFLNKNSLLANQESTNLLGYANKLQLTEGQILENIQKIQLRNGLKPSVQGEIKRDALDLSVEMETGTGKTYVYLKTIMEMHRQYGFSKFIIVVPTIPIKEGVYKSLQITETHLKEHYANVNYKYFVYDSSRLNEIRDFATSDQLQIMVINIQAFAKDVDDDSSNTNRILLNYNDKLGYKPISLIQDTRPVVIVDEPQRVLNTPLGKKSVNNLKPLAIVRYSATHKEKVNLLYKLDAVDAYNKQLVKQIEVASIKVDGAASAGAYIKLLQVSNKNGFKAKLELDVKGKDGKSKREKKDVKPGDDLLQLTKLEQYDGYMVRDIYTDTDNECIDFTNDVLIRLNMSIGGTDDLAIKRAQIAKTIEEHLNKELILNLKGIKVLSLFFIDKVSNYREYDSDGNPSNGIYARLFEEEYKKMIVRHKYKDLFESVRDLNEEVSLIHNGYFAVDKKPKASNTKDKFEYYKDTTGKTKNDEDTYNLIMRDKEKLLSFESKLRFIFSHTALREGWDNPNVFQICTLKDSGGTDISRRQEIGRGLRLCVNQDGDRVHGFDTNTLTVMANESYEEFVKNFQKEMEEETGIVFGLLQPHSFSSITVEMDGNDPVFYGQEQSEQLFGYFALKGYIDPRGKVQELLKNDLRIGEVDLPEEMPTHIKAQVIEVLKQVAGKLEIKNNENKKKVNVRKEVFLSQDFVELWDRVKYKTTFSVQFDSEKLIEACIKHINDRIVISKGIVIYSKSKLEITKGGIGRADNETNNIDQVDQGAQVLPDIVTYLQNETNLTRMSIVRILQGCINLRYFKINPQKFIEACIEIINEQMRLHIVDGIVYKKIGAHEFYSQELFENEELFGYLKSNMIESKKSPYEFVVHDSAIESNLAKEFEKNENVKVYAKLPSWFKIDTPLGTYNPDWALLFEMNSSEKLFFVVESKGTLGYDFLRPSEKGKIDCGKRHFEELSKQSSEEISLLVASDIKDIYKSIK
ncbi:DEAD/DEAH box helicase family protein [Flavobacterium filum]|uniref:type III restriction-modification system endonuclease n=1 Tax=Flavobacterium filum TaxID=370974 RepID=UPI0023F3D7FC|nr:DEAD/DEAH box helicase family protein [Flavobacterium filum]